MTSIATGSLRAIAIAAAERHEEARRASDQQAERSQLARDLDTLRDELKRRLNVTDGYAIGEHWTSNDSREARARMDGLQFKVMDACGLIDVLHVLVPCARECGKELWVDVETLEQLGRALDGSQHHAFHCLQQFDDEGEPTTDISGNPLPPRQPVPVRLSPEEKARQSIGALPLAAANCAAALNRVALLEDDRAGVKADAIRRLVDTGRATSPTSAEKIVELDEIYAAHRSTQRDAEIEKWRAASAYEASKLRAQLDVALVRGTRDE